MNTQAKQGIGRREFLVLTSSTALAAMAFGQDLVPSFGRTSAASRGFSVGYAEPDALERAGDRFSANLVAAESVTSADGSFLRKGARFFVRTCNIGSAAGSGAVELQALYSVRTGAAVEKIPYGVFSYSKKKGAISASSAVKFTIPVDDDYRVRLLLNVKPENDEATAASSAAVSRRNLLSTAQSNALEAGAEPQAIDFTLNSDGGFTKLRRGFFVIAPLLAGQDAPRWERMQIRNDDKRTPTLFDGSGFDVHRADFDYVIFSVDYADDLPRPERTPVTRPE